MTGTASTARLRVAHTGDLDVATLEAARTLLDESFDGEFTGEDWDHTLGGMHALAFDGAELVGHAALVQRRLLLGGRALRTGYVEGLAVRSDRRRGGLGGALMAELERLVRGAYELGALSTTELAAGFYAGRGWVPWGGRTYALTPRGVVRTEDEDDAILVLPCAVPIDLTGDLTCDWRDGDLW